MKLLVLLIYLLLVPNILCFSSLSSPRPSHKHKNYTPPSPAPSRVCPLPCPIKLPIIVDLTKWNIQDAGNNLVFHMSITCDLFQTQRNLPLRRVESSRPSSADKANCLFLFLVFLSHITPHAPCGVARHKR